MASLSAYAFVQEHDFLVSLRCILGRNAGVLPRQRDPTDHLDEHGCGDGACQENYSRVAAVVGKVAAGFEDQPFARASDEVN